MSDFGWDDVVRIYGGWDIAGLDGVSDGEHGQVLTLRLRRRIETATGRLDAPGVQGEAVSPGAASPEPYEEFERLLANADERPLRERLGA